MSAILKFDFQKRKQLRFSEVNYLNYTKKDPILHLTTTFSPKTRGNIKNKPWTHITPLKKFQMHEKVIRSRTPNEIEQCNNPIYNSILLSSNFNDQIYY